MDAISRLRWYGNVVRKVDEDLTKKCMEIGVEVSCWKTKKDMVRQCGNIYDRTRDQQTRHL